jgi:hypothetical protein
VQIHLLLGVALACVTLAACGGGGKRNSTPVASVAALAVNEDQTGTVSPSVSDPDNDALTVSIVAAPAKGTASVTTNQPLVITYVPNANANGADGFDYRVGDGRGGSATARVTVTIAPVADAPAMAAQSFSLSEDAQLDTTIVASEPDADAMAFAVTTAPAHGTLQLTNAATGAFRYVPATDFNGDDSFAVSVSDAGGLTTTAQMALAVQAVNDAPIAATDAFVAATTGPTTFDVLANDTDVDDTQLAVTLVSTAPGANALIVGNTIEVTPAAGALGPSSLVYRVSDSSGASATAAVRFVIGSATPLFYRSDENSPGEGRVFRFDMLERVEIDTPVGAGEVLGSFATSADGSALVYATIDDSTGPARHRLWFKDLTDEDAFVEEIPTPTNFFPHFLEISPNGQHILFDENYVSRANLGQPTAYSSEAIAWPRFTKNSDYIYYAQFLQGGGRVVNRVELNPTGGIIGQQQMTASPNVAEGLGLTLGLSPDETLIVTTGLVLWQNQGPKSHAYVTRADGLRNDVLLHPPFTTAVDDARQPIVTADNAYAYYFGTMNGVSGLYATNLQNLGTAVRLDVAPADHFVSSAVVLPDSRTLFYNLVRFPNQTWRVGRIDQPGVAEIYAPNGITDLRSLTVLPDGSALVLATVSNVHVARASSYLATTQLLTLPGTTITASPLTAPDSKSIAVHIEGSAGVRGRLHLVNPKIPGWSEELSPSTGNFGVSCVAYAGSRC